MGGQNGLGNLGEVIPEGPYDIQTLGNYLPKAETLKSLGEVPTEGVLALGRYLPKAFGPIWPWGGTYRRHL